MSPTDTDPHSAPPSRIEPEPERVGVRDLDRIREKVTFCVEPRLAVFAGIGGVLLLVAAFLAGLLLGRSCDRGTGDPAPSASETHGPGVVSSRPQVEASPPRARRHSVLPVAAVRMVVRGPSPSLPGDRRVADEVPVPRDPDPMAQDAPWPALAVHDPCAGASCVWPQGCDAPGPTLSDVRGALTRHWQDWRERWRLERQHTDRTIRSAGQGFLRWVAVALRPPPVPSTPVPTPSPPAREVVKSPPVAAQAHPTALAGGVFTVQVRSYRDEALAREYAASLRASGWSVEVVRHDDEAGQAWFRVRVGRFPSLAEARDFARRLNERTGDQAIVTAMEAR